MRLIIQLSTSFSLSLLLFPSFLLACVSFLSFSSSLPSREGFVGAWVFYTFCCCSISLLPRSLRSPVLPISPFIYKLPLVQYAIVLQPFLLYLAIRRKRSPDSAIDLSYRAHGLIQGIQHRSRPECGHLQRRDPMSTALTRRNPSLSGSECQSKREGYMRSSCCEPLLVIFAAV